MPLISGDAVRRAVRGLDDERAVDFVAALFEARGATTSVDTGRKQVSADFDGREETYRVCTESMVEDADDAVVVLTRPAGQVRGTEAHRRVIDPEGLRAMLVYGVPRAEANALCHRFLGRPLVSPSRARPSAVALLRDGSATALVVGLVGFVLVVASLTGGASLGVTEGSLRLGAPASPGDEAAASTTSPETPTGATDAASAGVTSDRLPPGVQANGSIDEDTLADAHATAITGRSYRWTLTYREFVAGRETGISRETVSVKSPTVYRTDRRQYGRLRETSLAISNVEAYADGTTRFERRVLDDGFDRAPPRPQPVRGVRNGEGRYADRAEQYVQWYLSVSESSLVDVVEVNGVRMYWLSLGADPYPGVENSSGSALVDERGVVHEVRRSYEVPRRTDDLRVVMTFRYTDIGTTTVFPPMWYERRANTTTTTGSTTEPTSTQGTISTIDTDATSAPTPNRTATTPPSPNRTATTLPSPRTTVTPTRR